MIDYLILKNKEEDFKVLETGFSYFALLYGPLWAAFNLLWIPCLLGIFIIILLTFIFKSLGFEYLYFFIGLLTNLFWGAFGRDLLLQKHINKNYYPVKIIGASSRKKALIKYLSE